MSFSELENDTLNQSELNEITINYSRKASDAGEFHLKTKSRDIRVIFAEK